MGYFCQVVGDGTFHHGCLMFMEGGALAIFPPEREGGVTIHKPCLEPIPTCYQWCRGYWIIQKYNSNTNNTMTFCYCYCPECKLPWKMLWSWSTKVVYYHQYNKKGKFIKEVKVTNRSGPYKGRLEKGRRIVNKVRATVWSDAQEKSYYSQGSKKGHTWKKASENIWIAKTCYK